MKWWDTISNIGLDDHSDIQQVRHVHILNRIFFLAVFFTGIYIPYLLLLASYNYAVIQATCMLFITAAYWFNHRKWFRFSAYYVFAFIIFNLNLALLMFNAIGIEFLMAPASLAGFVIFRRKSDSLVVLAAFMAGCAVSEGLKTHIPPSIVLEEEMRMGFYYANIFVAFIVSGSVIVNFRNVIDSYEKTMLAQKRQIEEKNKEITDSITYASRIQRALLTPEKYITRKLEGAGREGPDAN